MASEEPPAVAELSIADTANEATPAAAAEPTKKDEHSEPLQTADAAQPDSKKQDLSSDQFIDPWNVNAGKDEYGNIKTFDYKAISAKWNTQLIEQDLLDRFERVTGHKPHRWLRRGLFFSHRDFDQILTCYEEGEPLMLYTGRGPSSGSMHIGHTIPFEFTKWLQDVFDVPLVIMLTDDEKFLFSKPQKNSEDNPDAEVEDNPKNDKTTAKKNNSNKVNNKVNNKKDNKNKGAEEKKPSTIEDFRRIALENAKDIVALGFDKKKTFIFRDSDCFSSHFYQNVLGFCKAVTFNQVRGTFGFNESTNIGSIAFPAYQCSAAFPTSFPHIWGDDPEGDRQQKTANIRTLIPCAIDQDPYFRLLRDNASKVVPPVPKPALIHSKFLTALSGPGGKMSASDENSAIYMSDEPSKIKKKINSHAFSGGRETLEEHRKYGGNPDIDVSYQYLSYFWDDDVELAKVRDEYRSGNLLTGDLKKKCITTLQEYVANFQEARKGVTDELLKEYMQPRKLEWKGNLNPKPKAEESAGAILKAEKS